VIGAAPQLSKELDWGKKEVCVRVNAIGAPEHGEDILAVRRIERVDMVLVPKAEGDCSADARKVSSVDVMAEDVMKQA
jgi:citrate lyase beta subunit